ncbi:MAG: DUF1801 domain-containing protein [Thermoplasmatota archaeon]
MPNKTAPKAKLASRSTKPRKTSAKPKPKAKPTSHATQGDWRAATLDRMRRLIQEADPDAVEEVKWRKPSNAMQGVPTWSHDGLLCTGETYKDKVKFTFARGAALEDPAGLFNADDKGGTRRAMDVREGKAVDAAAFKALIRDAVAFNASGG